MGFKLHGNPPESNAILADPRQPSRPTRTFSLARAPAPGMLPPMPAVITQSICAFALASASTPSPEDPATREAFRMGFTLLGLVAVIGVLLVFGAALLFVLARNRRAQRDLDRRLNRPSSRADAPSAARPRRGDIARAEQGAAPRREAATGP